MRNLLIPTAIAAVLIGLGGSVATAAERCEDAVGDADGDSPDIVAVTVSEPEWEPTIRFEIELAPERPFGTDMETWTDTIFIIMSDKPTTDERGILAGDHYTTGTHGVTLPMQEQTGAFLVTENDMYYYVVDVDAAGPVLSFTLDRKLIGSPLDLYFQVLLGVEREEQMKHGGDGESEMEGDVYPELDEPPALYRIGATGE